MEVRGWQTDKVEEMQVERSEEKGQGRAKSGRGKGTQGVKMS